MRQNAQHYKEMKRILTIVTGGHLTMSVLLNLVNKMAKAKQLNIDRSARRMKDCLICWFCENVSVHGVAEVGQQIDPTPFVTPLQTNGLPADPFEVESDAWPWRDELPNSQ
jgi:hypothetical protein